MTKKIYIYSDEGVGDFSLFCTQQYFSSDDITLVKAKDIIKNDIPDDVDIFIMPGGADKPYAKNLNGQGNRNIRQYVENGGIYLGICAGAYYGCNNIEFQKGSSGEICEDRELSFFQGTAIGCLPELSAPYEQTLKTATITKIGVGSEKHNMLYWGGCKFETDIPQNHEIIARYEGINNNPPAIILCAVGKGKAILSGVHFETSREEFLNYNFNNDEENNLRIALAENLVENSFNIQANL